MRTTVLWASSLLLVPTWALRYDPDQLDWNLNQNANAVDPLDYSGQWENHTFNPSPDNWRFPFYTIMMDRFVNGDPTNDDANGTLFEHDIMGNQLRHGGDLQGLIDSLDYLQGLGIKALYVAGSPHINMPWGADAYSPLDLTLLDHHFGTIEEWRAAVTEIHRRGMYLVLDNTMATMGDLIGFDGYLNATTPFTLQEHEVTWKSDRRYLDFDFGNDYNHTCQYPRFWLETGSQIGPDVLDQMKGCYNSDFDQYGDTEAFGVFPDWQRQLSKFASVQDRLREWNPSVLQRIQHFSCITIAMLDIDGFRMDKATQVTVDAQGDWSDYIRQCASHFGKNNFFIPGEITGGNTYASIYLGRGKEPEMAAANLTAAVTMTNESSDSLFIRDHGKSALDAAAFHYTIYRSLTRFLGMDGNLAAGYDAPLNWVDAWNTMLLTNDLVNPNTGIFDPRHMYGVTNQDVFRWPGIKNGTQKMILGLFITTIHMPGIPLLLWGEEQAFYVLDSTADNYIFGRQAMSSALAWETHGCYRLGSVQYYQFPIGSNANGCHDDWNSLDHRDPSAPVHNIIKAMYHMRQAFPVLNDGYFLQQLSNQTREVQYPGSDGVLTEIGLWSTLRDRYEGVQNLGEGNQSVWLVYQNDNVTKRYTFNCSNDGLALVAPFESGTTVKNLFFPHEEFTLQELTYDLGLKETRGCLPDLDMEAWGFKAFVPIQAFVPPPPMITKFLPGHDARLQSTVAPGQQETVQIGIHFSAAMDCNNIRDNLKIESTTEDKRIAQLDLTSIKCSNATDTELPNLVGAVASAFIFEANLINVSNGVHAITVQNATTEDGKGFTNSFDKFLIRVGQIDNPIVFPRIANYTRALLHKDDNGTLFVSHKAAGADQFRYSLDFGSSYSNWQTYLGGNSTVVAPHWTGTKLQAWENEHVIMQYWSQMTGSSDYFQHADLGRDNLPPRRFPHLFVQGPFNQYGYDAGVENQLQLGSDARWTINFMTEWPSKFHVNVWGMNPDGLPDQTVILGDINNDSVLDRLPPSSLTETVINITSGPPAPFLAYRLSINDGNYNFELIPVGSRFQQILLYGLLATVPVITGLLGVWAFMLSFYKVKFNEIGFEDKREMLPLAIRRRIDRMKRHGAKPKSEISLLPEDASVNNSMVVLPKIIEPPKRRCVLIATMEYDIEDWNIKIKIGGLGVMAQLMGKHLGHQDLIWVVPCVGGIQYPVDTPMEPMEVTVLGSQYEIKVQKHTLKNITYILLDAPVFRQQTKTEPYPSRMDDLDSAVYYSAWNQCIALAIKRFPIDLYHVNDYHGAVAPLHLLPQTIPICLSLHNAEFQGLWPMRTTKEVLEVCSVYNLDPEVVERYVQFGDVFNLLHAGSSYLRIYQKGFGAVGVSRKYGKRSYARYPIFWGLTKVGKLPNPDPTDLDGWDGKAPKEEDVKIDQSFESARAELKQQAQKWAGLDENPEADLMVFVGRWSMQKGVDLIADIMPSILEDNKNVQLICVGPVIDLYGKFAALKLERMMKLYPGRVYSKPEFTALPPYIFSGAEFALIPSRDEPFGLVAVEFGRKGALGIGARVGGLGNMPGWWYTVESTTTSHVLQQFRTAIKEAIASKQDVRAQMRARSAKQRFPVQTWMASLEKLQASAIKIHHKETNRFHYRSRPNSSNGTPSGAMTPISGSATPSRVSRGRLSGYFGHKSDYNSGVATPNRDASPAVQNNIVSMGIRAGPGHERSLDKSKSKGRASDSRPVSDIDDTDDEEARTHYIDEYTMTRDKAQAIGIMRAVDSQGHGTVPPIPSLPSTAIGSAAPSILLDSLPPTPGPYYSGFNPMGLVNAQLSTLSLDQVIGEKKDFSLQKVDPFFTDTNGEFYGIFSERLDKLNGKNSESEHCIEEFLIKSEKKWFDRFREAKLGITPSSTPASSIYRFKREGGSHAAKDSIRSMSINTSARSSVCGTAEPTPAGSISAVYLDHMEDRQEFPDSHPLKDEFLLGDDYKPPRGLKKLLQYRLGDWPIYSFFLAFGQIIAANSYQITLLTGSVGQSADKLYVVASIYLGTTIIWWIVFRKLPSIYVLSLPFVFYGLAFFFIGITPWVHSFGGRGWVHNVATGLYATASSSGSLYFALNFGDEGGAPVKTWVYRACVIQGTQQIYVVGLWYWGSTLTKATSAGAIAVSPITNSWVMSAITIPIAGLLWFIGFVIFVGLPDYYRQSSGTVPSFYRSLIHRKIILWFFVVVIIQNYWLSGPYGRNWSYLWSSNHAKPWHIALLILGFFVGVWAAWLSLFGFLSRSHSWILPLFAIGLGAPRWCQILWATSNVGFYLPWAGGPVASALVGRSLWLWLGVLDALQGVGLGMILLQTLTRIHIAFTLIAAQVLGSAATILARATAPNKIGPGDVFPDFSGGPWEGVTKLWFWVALGFQMIICVGFFLFFRKEQLTKP